MISLKNLFKTTVAILILTSPMVKAGVIPVQDLFSSPNLYSVKLNPSAKYVAKHHFRGEDYDVIEILDVENNHYSDAFRLKVVKHAYIQDYDWVDEDTLYIAYRLKRNVYKRVLIDLDYEKLKIKGEKISTAHYFDSDARIIDPLRHQKDKLLVQKVRDGEPVVYYASTQNLIQDKYYKKDRFKKQLESALGYFTGNNGLIQFSVTIEDQRLKFWYLQDYNSEWKELFEFGEFDFKFEPIQIMKDGEMVVLTNKDTDKVVLQEFNYLTKEFGEVLYQHERYDLAGASVSAVSGLVESVSYYQHGNLTKEFFVQQEKELSDIFKSKFPNKQVAIHSRESGAEQIVLFVHSPNDSGEFYWLNRENKQTKSLGLRFEKFKDVKFSDTKNFNVSSPSGVEIEAILTEPHQSNGVLLVSPHGGPIGVRNIDVFSKSNQFYASRGYSVLNINFRGSHGYGKKFLSEGAGQFGQIIEEDISLVVDKVRKSKKYRHICSVGSSYGGYSSVILAAYHPKVYDCVVGAYGIYDLPLLFNTSNIQMQERHIKAVSKTVGEFNPSLKLYSPVYFAEKINSPVLLIAGKSDEVSGFEQTNRMAYRLNQLKKPVETLFYEDTGHGHTSQYWDRHEHVAVDEFIRRHLNLDSLPKAQQKIIDRESVLLADSFNFDDKVRDDEERALSFYKIAARGEDPRATYNLANYYLKGEFVEKDNEKAFDLYQKSADLGFAQASYKLGWFHMTDEYDKQDFHKAREYFSKALEAEHKEAEYQIGRIDCLKIRTDSSQLSCYQHIEKLIKQDDEKIIDLFSELFFDVPLSNEQTNKMVDYVEQTGLKTVAPSTEFELTDYGSYYLKYWKYKNSRTSTELTLEKNEIIGVTVRFDDDSSNSSDVVLFKEIWHHPDLADNGSSEPITKSTSLVRAKFNQEVYLFFKFKNKRMKKPGIWRLELQTLDGKLLAEKSFNVKFE